MAAFDESHFIPLDSQTNIYGLTRITDDTEITKVLVGSSKGKVTSVEYVNEWDNPVAREVPFTYIPSGDAEIISIDAFTRQSINGSSGLVIGISFVLSGKNSQSNQKQFLSIYSSVEEDQENSLDSIAEGCQHIELKFVPFQLYHTKIIRQKEQTIEAVFLLSGSDCKIHMYQEVTVDGHRCFEEQSIDNAFPEFKTLPSNVLWMDIHHIQDKRVSAIGFQDGHVQLSVVDNLSHEPNIKASWTVQHDGPVTSVKLFSRKSVNQQYQDDESQEIIPHSVLKDCHLLVCCAVEPCTLYIDATVHGLERPLILPDSDNFDCVLCACIADVDWDGNNEILLGTFGQELLAYKMSSSEGGCVEVSMAWQRRFNSPIFAVDYVDMTRDGLCEIVVACLSGIHILQHHLDVAANTYTTRVLGQAQEEQEQTQHEESDISCQDAVD